jgi:hypothetical protein
MCSGKRLAKACVLQFARCDAPALISDCVARRELASWFVHFLLLNMSKVVISYNARAAA